MPVSALLLGVLGLAVLIGGAEVLVRSASRLAERLGLPTMVIGLTVVSIGTSLPELAIGIDAARSGAADIATGNVVGTNLVNLLLVLGLAALLRPIRFDRTTLRVDAPAMVVASLLLAALAFDGSLGPIDGAVLLAGTVVYLVLIFRTRPREEVAEVADPDGADGGSRGGVPLQLLLLVVSIALVVLGADWLVDGAVEGARAFGVDEAVIGLTVVAIGTSAPELATMLVALARGESGLAVGNLLGSSVFNIVLVLGATTLAAPGARIPVEAEVLGADLLLAVVATLVVALAMRTGSRLSRTEGGLLVAGYVAYLAWLVVTRF